MLRIPEHDTQTGQGFGNPGQSGPGSTTAQIRGKVRRDHENDAEIIASIDEKYKNYRTEDDILDDIMNTLPEKLELSYLEEQLSSFKEKTDSVQRQFKKNLLDNSHQFIHGMQQIQDVKMDLHLTNLLCKNSRRTLIQSDEKFVHTCFGVIQMQQRRKRMLDSMSICIEVRKLFETERELKEHLEEGHFIGAIKLHTELLQVLKKYDGLHCLEKMARRFEVELLNYFFIYLLFFLFCLDAMRCARIMPLTNNF